MRRKREKIYIVPSQYGFMYGMGILVSLFGGAIYNNNLAFMLCFFLVALFLIGMVQTHANIRYLDIEKLVIFLSPSESTGHGVVWLKSRNAEGHSQLQLEIKDNDDFIKVQIPEIYKNSLYPHYFDFPTGKWGKKSLKKIKLSTRYPFGFFYAWRHYPCQVEYRIYPKPGGILKLEDLHLEGLDHGRTRQLQGDDFSEHKKYIPGESQKHIDWKAFARGRPLLTKKFNEGERQTFLMDYDQVPGSEEHKVRQLSKWIHDCHEQGNSWGLKIRGQFFSPNFGEKHKQACLKALADLRSLP